jgi:HSP20 family molecular chaperone IbpA
MKSSKKQRKKDKIVVVPPTGKAESGNRICIVTHLYGIPEEDIRIDLDRNLLMISASKPNEAVMQKIPIPAGSRICKKKFLDGILEIILEKPV